MIMINPATITKVDIALALIKEEGDCVYIDCIDCLGDNNSICSNVETSYEALMKDRVLLAKTYLDEHHEEVLEHLL